MQIYYYKKGKVFMGDNIIFQKLTPTDSVDMEVYEEAFEYIFKNTDVKNVAIAGPYSAGKSSLLESFKKNSDKKFMHISLAHFEETTNQRAAEEDKETKNNKDIETELEGKILNQLIQQIEVENIPQTNFHIKRTVNNHKCAAFSVGTIVFVLCVLHLRYFKLWSGWVYSLADSWVKGILRIFTNPYSLIGSGIAAMAILGVGIYQLLKTQKNKNIFRKLSVQGNEIEIFGEDDNSYFDKYLNEVLYLFENSGVDVIVFEDLDRFDDNRIFERLREINILSNIRLQKRKGKKNCRILRFFYLLRDDIFVNKDRTKFFEFILPVVPVLDSSNAYDQIKEHFGKGGVFDKFEEKFLRGLSLYIDDMRILKNIYNEFMVYFNKLNTIELNPNKMLAIITYKNIFPRDFSDLQLNQGFVYELFRRKGEFIEQEKLLYEDRIKDQEIRIQYVKNENLESITELNDVQAARYDRLPSSYYGKRNTDEYDKWIKVQYPLRKRAIEDKTKNLLKELDKELRLLQEEHRNIENKVLHEIITRENVEEIFRISSKNEIGAVNEYKEIKSSEYFSLLKFLIWRGYIDESYSDYMTFFYENSLTKGDKVFLRSITDKKAKPFSYTLDNVSLVMTNLDISDFEQEETLNFDLFEYLLQNKEKKDFLLCFVKQLKRESRFQFLGEFFEKNRERENLVKVVNDQWPLFVRQVLAGRELSMQLIKEYSVATLEYMSETELNEINAENCLTNYISSQQDYLAIENPNIKKLCKAMKVLGVLFKQIDFQESNPDLFHAVYKNSLYEINVSNIRLMLEVEYGIQNVENALKQCISTIFSHPEQPLCKYVQEDMDLFLETVLNVPINGFTDSSADVVTVINDVDISEEHKIAYIKNWKLFIDTLADIDDVKYQTELISLTKVQYTVENILEYFGKMGLTEDLIRFINVGNVNLNYNDIDSREPMENFWDQCISCAELSLKKYKEILLSISPTYTEFDVVGIPEDKMEILVENKIVPMTEGTLVFMRKNYECIKMQYIKNNIAGYADVAIGSIASVEELKEILLWDVSNKIKYKLLDEIQEGISITDQNYSDEIVIYILKNNLCESDLPMLYQDYNMYEIGVQGEIVTIAKARIEEIVNDIQYVSRELIEVLLKDKNIGVDKRVNLFVAIANDLTSDACHDYLEFMGMKEFVKIFEQNKRPKIRINPMNEKILTTLKECGFIDSFFEDEESNIFKQIRRRKITKKELPDELL